MRNYEAELQTAVELKHEAEETLHETAWRAHQDGVSWDKIAKALGMTRQSASANFRLPPMSVR